MRPSAGEIEVLGRSMPEHTMAVLPSVGALVEGPAFYPFLSGARNLVRFDAAEGTTRTTRRSRTADVLDRVGLSGAADKRYRQYSLGMKQRLALAAALLRPRQLIVLDEPTNRLDPQRTGEVRDLIRALAANRTTVCLSSHLRHEVEQVCTHAAILSRGTILSQGSLPALTGTSRTARITVSHPVAAAVVLSQLPGLGDIQVDGSTVLVELHDVPPQLCNRTLVEQEIDVAELVVAQPSLQDLFLAATGDTFDVG
jgi:ABC-2 type transport system ATP-binding protein